MEERWAPILGWEGLYEVSTEGRVRSIDRTVDTPTGPQMRRGRLLKLRPHSRGYTQVGLTRDGRTRVCLVHHLVLESFVGPRPRGCECRHFPDNDRTNNRLSNLSWGTSAENAADRARTGTQHRGSRTGGARLRESDIPKIRARLAGGERHSTIAEDFGVHAATIGDIARGLTWRHV